MMGRILFVGAVVGIVVSGAPAAAQELQEIVVTAQRRSENLQNVPITVSSVSADELSSSGVTGINSLAMTVPGLTVVRSAATTAIYIRGVGTTGGSAGQENAVATYVDGVYMPSQAGANFPFNNVERIEVLKGPQGTLFGRNATGGVVNIITRTPSHDPSLDAEVGYGNFNTAMGSLYATTGLGAMTAADIAISYENQRDGFGRNLVTSDQANWHRNYGVRSKILFEPADNTRITVQGDYTEVDGDVPYRSFTPTSTQFFTGQVGWPHAFWDFESDLADPPYKVKNWGLSARLEQNLGWSHLTAISAFRALSMTETFDVDMSPLPLFNATLDEVDRQFSQEINLASDSSSAVQWLGGLYYLQGPSRFAPWHIYGQLFSAEGFTDERVYSEQYTKSYAAYAQTTFAVMADTNLTLGARYTLDKRELTAPAGTLDLVGGIQLPAVPPQDRSTTFRQPTWRVSLDHKVTPDLMLYASYSRGFHSGIYNLSGNVITSPVVQPETLDAFELGVKSTVAHRLRLDASAFYYNYKNLQLTEIEGPTEVLLNAARARMFGLDASIDAVIATGLSVKAGGELMRAYYTNFPDAPITSVNTVFPFGDNITSGSAQGHWLDKTPQYNLNLSADYTAGLAGGDLDSSVTYAYSGRFYFEPDNRLAQGAHGLLNGGLRWTAPQKQFYVRAFANNLTNKKYLNQGLTGATGDLGVAAPARTYGLALGVSVK